MQLQRFLLVCFVYCYQSLFQKTFYFPNVPSGCPRLDLSFLSLNFLHIDIKIEDFGKGRTTVTIIFNMLTICFSLFSCKSSLSLEAQVIISAISNKHSSQSCLFFFNSRSLIVKWYFASWAMPNIGAETFLMSHLQQKCVQSFMKIALCHTLAQKQGRAGCSRLLHAFNSHVTISILYQGPKSIQLTPESPVSEI